MRCCIFGAAKIYDYTICRDFLDDDTFVICADGGVRHAKVLGIHPDLIVGDFDSVKEQLSQDGTSEIIMLPKEKDDTDIYFAVREAINRGFSDVTILGGTGGRFDHTLANLSALYFLRLSGVYGRIIDEQNRIEILLSGERSLPFQLISNYKYISVLPYGCRAVEVEGEGLRYKLPEVISAEFPIGVSNEVISKKSFILVKKGVIAIIFSKD